MSLSKTVSLEKAMHMSLDDYIVESGLYVSPMLKQPKFKTSHKTKNVMNESDVVMGCDEQEIKEETLSEIGGEFDLRNTIIGKEKEKNDCQIPKANSQQWRLMQPNISKNRPPGMAPLVPDSAEISHCDSNLNTNNDRANFNNSYNNRNNNWNRGGRGRRRSRNNNNNNNSNNNGNFRNNWNNGRVQRFNPNPNQNIINFNYLKTAIQNLQRKNPTLAFACGDPQDLTISANVEGIKNWNNRANNNNNNNNKIPSLLETELIKPPFVNDPPAQTTSTLANLNLSPNILGETPRLEIMPMLAGKLLEILQIAGVDKTPKYDMKVQKEIHALQKKPMIYKCPSGEVISSDGPGLTNCSFQPKSTGISLNQRFS